MATRGERMLTGFAVDHDVPGVGQRQAVQDAHQGRLARAVLAEQRVDLALGEVEVHVVVGEQRAEALGDATKQDGRCRPPCRALDVHGSRARLPLDAGRGLGAGSARVLRRQPAGLAAGLAVTSTEPAGVLSFTSMRATPEAISFSLAATLSSRS